MREITEEEWQRISEICSHVRETTRYKMFTDMVKDEFIIIAVNGMIMDAAKEGVTGELPEL